jgi:hypothetical protein
MELCLAYRGSSYGGVLAASIFVDRMQPFLARCRAAVPSQWYRARRPFSTRSVVLSSGTVVLETSFGDL